MTGVSEAVSLVQSTELSGVAEYAYAALAADGSTVAPGDVRAQADQVMVTLRTSLNDAVAALSG